MGFGFRVSRLGKLTWSLNMTPAPSLKGSEVWDLVSSYIRGPLSRAHIKGPEGLLHSLRADSTKRGSLEVSGQL